MDAVHFSSDSSEWGTPADFWAALDRQFHFTVDLAASAANHKCTQYFSIEHSLFDHLHEIKKETCWLNPVYGDPELPCKPRCKKATCLKRGYHNETYRPGISDFIEAAATLHHQGNTVVILPPARTDTAWWHGYIMRCSDEIWLLRGRLKFEMPDGTQPNSAPFPSAVVVFRPRKPHEHLGPLFRSVEVSHYIAQQTPLVAACMTEPIP